MIDRSDLHIEASRQRNGGFDLTLRRNCSLAPCTLVALLGAVAAVSLAIGLGFALVGLWLVLPFVGLEIAALVAAFVVHARHIADRESVTLHAGELAIEIREGVRTQRYAFNAHWVPVALRRSGLETRLYVGPADRQIEIGRHLGFEERKRLAQDLSARLRSFRAGGSEG